MAVRGFRASDDDAARVREALDAAENVDASRIDVELRASSIALRGWVPAPEQATIAVTVAEGAMPSPVTVVDELQTDPHLREVEAQPRAVERTIPAEGETLVGDPDMLAGPAARIETDVARAIEDSEPWMPPDEPSPVPEPHTRGGTVIDDEPAVGSIVPPASGPAAADLTAAEVAHGRAPSLSPDAARAPGEDVAEKVSTDEFGRAPDDDALEPMVDQVPGTEPGPGAVGEHTTGGGSAGSETATETGARGVDTEASDPARWGAGGTSHGAGTHRGPQSRDDESAREEPPEAD
jgi:hypothetical protein